MNQEFKSCTIKAYDAQELTQYLPLYIKANMKAAGFSKAKMAKLTKMPKSWIAGKSKKVKPNWKQLKNIAKTAKITIKLEFGTPQIAAIRWLPVKDSPILKEMKVLYRTRKYGKATIWYKDEEQLKDGLKAVIADILQQQGKAGWTQSYANIAEKIDKGKLKYQKIEKICQQLDVTITAQFSAKK